MVFNWKKIAALLLLVSTVSIIMYFSQKMHAQQRDPRDISMITYGLSGSRFGDGLVSYMHAKWLSFKYDIPLLYNPFPQSEHLNLAQKEFNQEKHPLSLFKEIVYLSSPKNIERFKNHKKEKGILYVIPYYSEYEDECNNAFFKQFFTIEWRNPKFYNLLRSSIFSDTITPKPVIYPNMANVALHLRTGRGFDNLAQPGKDFKQAMAGEKRFCNVNFPFKLPALNFYSNALHQLALLLKQQPIHVHIFTDDPNPEEVIESLKKQMTTKYTGKIEYTYNKTSQSDLDILEDFFTITHFDYLIRPASNFSLSAAKIGKFLIEISPKGLVVTDQFFFINQFHVEYSNGKAFDITIPVEE